jgi:hypothetical protein
MMPITKERFRELIFTACPTARIILLYGQHEFTANRTNDIFDAHPELHNEERIVLGTPGFNVVTVWLLPVESVSK